MVKKPKKVRVNFTLDEALYKKMQFYSDKIGLNWSHMIEQSVVPLIVAFDDIFKQIEASGESDVTKIRMLFQKLIFEVTGQAYKAYDAIEKDLEEKQEKPKKKESFKQRKKDKKV